MSDAQEPYYVSQWRDDAFAAIQKYYKHVRFRANGDVMKGHGFDILISELTGTFLKALAEKKAAGPKQLKKILARHAKDIADAMQSLDQEIEDAK